MFATEKKCNALFCLPFWIQSSSQSTCILSFCMRSFLSKRFQIFDHDAQRKSLVKSSMNEMKLPTVLSYWYYEHIFYREQRFDRRKKLSSLFPLFSSPDFQEKYLEILSGPLFLKIVVHIPERTTRTPIDVDCFLFCFVVVVASS